MSTRRVHAHAWAGANRATWPAIGMRLAVAVALAGAALLAFGAAAPKPAPASASTLTCPFEVTLSWSPPVTHVNGDADFATDESALGCAGLSRSASLRLVGTAGEAPPPAGGETCLRGAGYGRVELRFGEPSRASATAIDANFTYRHVGSVWNAEGRQNGPRGHGRVTIAAIERPEAGGCSEGPKARSTLAGLLTIEGVPDGASASGVSGCENELVGTSRGERIRGGPEADCVFGRGGADRIAGGRGADRIRCGAGRDTVRRDAADRVGRDCERVVYQRGGALGG